jgi:aromatic amino acid aminotransferase I
MQIAYEKHPHFPEKTITEIEKEIFMASIEQGALVTCGSWFQAEHDVEHDTLFFRATYAAAPFEKIQEAIRRFGDAVKISFGLPVEEGVVEL